MKDVSEHHRKRNNLEWTTSNHKIEKAKLLRNMIAFILLKLILGNFQ